LHYLDTLAGMSAHRAWLLYGIKKPGWGPQDEQLAVHQTLAHWRTLVQEAVLEVDAPWDGPGLLPPVRLPSPPLPAVAQPAAQLRESEEDVCPSPPPPRRGRRARGFSGPDPTPVRPYGVSGVTRLLVGYSRGYVPGERMSDPTGRDDERWRRTYDRSRQLTL